VKAHFEIEGHFDTASKVQKATLTIDRANGLAQVRLHRRHKSYELPLSKLAEIIYQRAVTAELAAKPRRRKMAKRGLLSVGR
jgi:hypothetical protein